MHAFATLAVLKAMSMNGETFSEACWLIVCGQDRVENSSFYSVP